MFQYILCVGSRITLVPEIITLVPFQYILCVGSREEQEVKNRLKIWFQYILCVGSSDSCPIVVGQWYRFQYILCVGSRWSICYWEYICKVSIHPMCRFKSWSYIVSICDVVCFNTSYVSVQGQYYTKECILKYGFNTSYVSVQGY